MLFFVKRPDELDTDLDKWLYTLKHLTEFKTRPKYLSRPQFDQLFNIAKYTNLSKEEQDMYNTSLKYKWDNKNVRDYAEEKGREEGLAKGIQEGIEKGLEQGREQGIEIGEAKGRYEEALEIAREMKKNAFPTEIISKVTKLSSDKIEAL